MKRYRRINLAVHPCNGCRAAWASALCDCTERCSNLVNYQVLEENNMPMTVRKIMKNGYQVTGFEKPKPQLMISVTGIKTAQEQITALAKRIVSTVRNEVAAVRSAWAGLTIKGGFSSNGNR